MKLRAQMALGGRPKEEGGHRPLKISLEQFISEALKKVGNKSKFIETVLRPILKAFEELSDMYHIGWEPMMIAQKIQQATEEGNLKKIDASVDETIELMFRMRNQLLIGPYTFKLESKEQNTDGNPKWKILVKE